MLLFHYIDDFGYFLVFRVFVLLIIFLLIIICDDSNGKNLVSRDQQTFPSCQKNICSPLQAWDVPLKTRTRSGLQVLLPHCHHWIFGRRREVRGPVGPRPRATAFPPLGRCVIQLWSDCNTRSAEILEQSFIGNTNVE